MAEDDQLLRRPSSQLTLDINTNVEAGLKIMNGLSWHLVEDGYLGIGKHRRKWILFGHAKVVLPSQSVVLNRIGK